MTKHILTALHYLHYLLFAWGLYCLIESALAAMGGQHVDMEKAIFHLLHAIVDVATLLRNTGPAHGRNTE